MNNQALQLSEIQRGASDFAVDADGISYAVRWPIKPGCTMCQAREVQSKWQGATVQDDHGLMYLCSDVRLVVSGSDAYIRMRVVPLDLMP